jgi:hypothetical protein
MSSSVTCRVSIIFNFIDQHIQTFKTAIETQFSLILADIKR